MRVESGIVSLDNKTFIGYRVFTTIFARWLGEEGVLFSSLSDN